MRQRIIRRDVKTAFPYLEGVKDQTSEGAFKLQALRKRAKLSRARVAEAAGRPETTYAEYETKYKKAHQPMWLVRALLPLFVGMGEPPIAREEVLDLAGVTELEDIAASEPPVEVLPIRSVSPVPGDPIYDLGEAGLLKIWRRLDEAGQGRFFDRLAAEEAAARRKSA